MQNIILSTLVHTNKTESNCIHFLQKVLYYMTLVINVDYNYDGFFSGGRGFGGRGGGGGFRGGGRGGGGRGGGGGFRGRGGGGGFRGRGGGGGFRGGRGR